MRGGNLSELIALAAPTHGQLFANDCSRILVRSEPNELEMSNVRLGRPFQELEVGMESAWLGAVHDNATRLRRKSAYTELRRKSA